MNGDGIIPGKYTSAVITFHWTCSECGAIEGVSLNIHPDSPVPRPVPLPGGWRAHGYSRWCPKHKVFIAVDSKVSEMPVGW